MVDFCKFVNDILLEMLVNNIFGKGESLTRKKVEISTALTNIRRKQLDKQILYQILLEESTSLFKLKKHTSL